MRGGTYSGMELTAEQRRVLSAELASANDLCHRCHRKGHFVGSCYAKTYANGELIPKDANTDAINWADSSEKRARYADQREADLFGIEKVRRARVCLHSDKLLGLQCFPFLSCRCVVAPTREWNQQQSNVAF